MPRLLQGVVGLLSSKGAVTHQGAAAFDLSVENPLLHLVFTKGAALLEQSFYRTQAEEIQSYAKALLAAEKAERGFGWKFAAYMREPERGKGNRIQGSVAPAILAAADPRGRYTAEYTYKCLRHRADDVALFVAHMKNLGLGEVPEAAKKGMARALGEMDEYQILKYASRQFPLLERRANGQRKSLRLVDAMGICKAHLDERTRRIYEYLHAPTRERANRVEGLPLTEARRRFFHQSNEVRDFAQGRLSTEQALSYLGNTAKTWRQLLDVPGLIGDLAFLRNLRGMYRAGLPVSFLVQEAGKRRFEGVWPHQVYAGYRAMVEGISRHVPFKDEPVFVARPCPELVPAFEAVLDQVGKGVLPPEPSLGLADVSGSMFDAPLGGMQSSMRVGDVSILFAAMMGKSLGYAATFSDNVFLAERGERTIFQHAEALRQGDGWGGTQVAGAVRHLLSLLLAQPQRARPRTLFFFSDMQFAPPAQQKLPSFHYGQPEQPTELPDLPKLDPRAPPLLAVLKLWRERLGPVDVVLWNLAAYDNAPLPSGMDHVLMLAGFDANSFQHVVKWQAQGSPGGTLSPKAVGAPTSAPPASAAKDPNVELDYIRGF